MGETLGKLQGKMSALSGLVITPLNIELRLKFSWRHNMALTSDDVLNIANLARLEITESEIGVYREKLTTILDMVDQLTAADTEGVVPMAHPLDMSQRLREDVVTETDQRKLYQQNATQTEAGLYLVPKVLE